MAKNPPYPPHKLPAGAKATKELLKYVPQLSLAERNRRWDGIRKKMMLANIDVLLILANDAFWDMGVINLRYITQIGSKMGGHALFFIDHDPIIWNSLPHMNRPTSLALSTQEWVSDIRPYGGGAEGAAAIREVGRTSGGARTVAQCFSFASRGCKQGRHFHERRHLSHAFSAAARCVKLTR